MVRVHVQLLDYMSIHFTKTLFLVVTAAHSLQSPQYNGNRKQISKESMIVTDVQYKLSLTISRSACWLLVVGADGYSVDADWLGPLKLQEGDDCIEDLGRDTGDCSVLCKMLVGTSIPKKCVKYN